MRQRRFFIDSAGLEPRRAARGCRPCPRTGSAPRRAAFHTPASGLVFLLQFRNDGGEKVLSAISALTNIESPYSFSKSAQEQAFEHRCRPHLIVFLNSGLKLFRIFLAVVRICRVSIEWRMLASVAAGLEMLAHQLLPRTARFLIALGGLEFRRQRGKALLARRGIGGRCRSFRKISCCFLHQNFYCYISYSCRL